MHKIAKQKWHIAIELFIRGESDYAIIMLHVVSFKASNRSIEKYVWSNIEKQFDSALGLPNK